MVHEERLGAALILWSAWASAASLAESFDRQQLSDSHYLGRCPRLWPIPFVCTYPLGSFSEASHEVDLMSPRREAFPLQIVPSECRLPVHRCADADVVVLAVGSTVVFEDHNIHEWKSTVLFIFTGVTVMDKAPSGNTRDFWSHVYTVNAENLSGISFETAEIH